MLTTVLCKRIIGGFRLRFIHVCAIMAKSKFEYVRNFETENKCLENCWIVVRVDGKGFHKFADLHMFERPNDKRGLELMTRAAVSVFQEFRDVCFAFGHSDEYSFVFKKNSNLYNRRYDKILTNVNSLFSSSYVFHWNYYFKDQSMLYPPSFDARIILYPSDENLRDYLSWRQADVHINNLYNTTFWALVLKKKLTRSETRLKVLSLFFNMCNSLKKRDNTSKCICDSKNADETLRGTLSSDKNEILFQEFNINYNNEPEMFRKGTSLVRKLIVTTDCGKNNHVVIPLYCDIISNKFWSENPEIIGLGKLQEFRISEDTVIFKGTNLCASSNELYRESDENINQG